MAEVRHLEISQVKNCVTNYEQIWYADVHWLSGL